MNLRSVDLNLLVILDALLTEQHVTRAAQRVGLSQPAMSNALKRLRDTMGDELLLRTPRGMELTPRGTELVEPVRQWLRGAERLLESASSFDPATSRMRLRLRMSDVLEHLLMPGLLQILETQAPLMSVEVVHVPPDATIAALERDEIDLAVSMDLETPETLLQAAILADRMICVMAKAHPLARGPLTLDRFLSAEHIKVSMSPLDGRYVDAALAGLGRERRIAVNLPHWLVVPHLLENSSYIAVMSEHLARRSPQNLAIQELPFASTDFSWQVYWHRRNHNVAASQWLRQQLLSVGDRLRQSLKSGTRK